MRVRVLLALGLVLVAALPAAGAQRMVLVEDFTNYQCPPCDAIKDTMDVIMDAWYGVKAAPIRYHMYWPAADDPAWLFNPTEAQERRTYYAVNYVPTFRWDGKYLRDPSDFGTLAQFYAYARNAVDSLAAIPSEVRIDLNSSQDPDSIYVDVDVVADSAISTNLVLYVAIDEEWLRFSPAGKFRYVFRDMLPRGSGDDVPVSAPGDSVHFRYATTYNDSAYHADRMIVTAWVQRPGTKKVVNANTMFVPLVATDVASGDAPLRMALDQNMPNPFNPTTTIGFSLDQAGPVKLSVFAPTGRLVTDLVRGNLSAGNHRVVWDGRDSRGASVGSGVYYYRLDTEKNSLTKKMILVR